MKNLIIFFITFLSFQNGNAQKVFSIDYSSQADVKVFVVDYESQADLKIFFVDYSSQAGWKNNSKKHLIY